MLLFTHIPKCGGKSFRESLKAAYGDELQLYYNNPLKKGPWRQALPAPVKRLLKPPVKPTGKVVYGHYCFDDFKAYTDRQTQYGAFFRDPVEWAGSYLLYMENKHEQKSGQNPVQEIRRLNLQSGYARFLGHVAVEQLDFVGLVEAYDESLALFSSIFGPRIDKEHINRTQDAPPSYRQYFKEQGVLDEIEALMAENKQIYDQVRARFDILMQQYAHQDSKVR